MFSVTHIRLDVLKRFVLFSQSALSDRGRFIKYYAIIMSHRIFKVTYENQKRQLFWLTKQAIKGNPRNPHNRINQPLGAA
jgi:type I site-specific restriction-modification system R (restriction) subunit